LDRGANVDMVVQNTTALIAAAKQGHLKIVSLLLGRGAHVNKVVKDTTALIAAAGQGHQDIVSLLLDRGADVSEGVKGTTALIVAAKQGHGDIVSLLLGRGADVNMIVHDTTALIAAVEEKQWSIVRLLLDGGADVNMAAHDTTALTAATQGGHRDVVTQLLDRGAVVNMVVHDTTALMVAVEEEQWEMVSLLLGRGADVNMIVHDTTALIAAVEEFEKQWSGAKLFIVKLLLDGGADVNMAVHDTTPLIAAARGGYRYVTLMLLDRGANVNMVAYDTTALTAAAQGGHRDVVLLLLGRGARAEVHVNTEVHDTTPLIEAAKQGHWEIVNLLLDRGANVSEVVGGTALIAAAKQGHGDTVSLLLHRGTDVNMVVHNTTALIAAVKQGHLKIVSMLLDGGAHASKVVRGITALIAAARKGHRDIVSLLLDRGADVSKVVKGTTALITAAKKGHGGIVSLLLGRGADVNMIVHDTTALIAAVEGGQRNMVSILLDRGADVNKVVHHTTAIIAAAESGNHSIVSLLLLKGADVNRVVHGTTALISAIAKGYKNIEVVRLLLDEGADLNVVGGQYGTALITAIYTCQSFANNNVQQLALLSMLLDHNPDVSIVAGVHGTALIAAISNLQFTQQTDCTQRDTAQSSGAWQWTFLKQLLRSEYLHRDHINIAVGQHGTPLTVAISKGNLQLLRLLVKRGGDVSRQGDGCGTALRAALAAGWSSEQLSGILQFLVEAGADINVVGSQQFGNALGHAAYMGNTELVSFLLERGADLLHVGGMYNQTSTGAYPTALDAALSPGSQAQSDLIAMLSGAMGYSGEFSQLHAQRSPPFPMPYTRSDAMPMIAVANIRGGPYTYPDTEDIRNLPAHAALTPQQADISCAALKEELVVQVLVHLVIGTCTATNHAVPESKCYKDWIRNDVRYFVSHGFDFGEAYAAARVGWKHFSEPDFVHLIAQHRGQWHGIAQKIDKERDNSINRNDAMGQEMIKEPYKVMPRRLWDLKSNRVVEFQMLHSELLAYKSTTEWQLGKARVEASHVCEMPVYWAISHSWESSMNLVQTSINQYQWQVPLPHGIDLDHDVRRELLSYGIEYVWLDALCLRQRTTSNLNPSNSSDETRIAEWKLDVPTIGNIYRGAQGIVRYFNGLGRPFRMTGWENDTHWLRRVWTLQEIKTENSTINGGIAKGFTPRIMNAHGMIAGQVMTLRRVLRPVLKLAADVDGPSGCSLYALAREISKRNATQNTDKVTALEYLLRLTELPTYDENLSDNHAWARCFHMLPLDRKIELLFDFPYRSEKQQQWFPTWNELMMWPAINPHCEYSPAVHVQTKGHRHLGFQDLTDLKEATEIPIEGSLFMPDIWAFSQCHITLTLPQGAYNEETEYEVRIKSKVYGFYSPYISQKRIETTSPTGNLYEFTIATADLGHSNSWVVCEFVNKLNTKCTWDSKREAYKRGESQQNSSNLEIEVYVLRKVGVLRTDYCGEILADVGGSGDHPSLRRIHALFV
ncbi:ankyrin repeat-containing domain protein, partial [Tirmania nivea]